MSWLMISSEWTIIRPIGVPTLLANTSAVVFNSTQKYPNDIHAISTYLRQVNTEMMVDTELNPSTVD